MSVLSEIYKMSVRLFVYDRQHVFVYFTLKTISTSTRRCWNQWGRKKI